MTRSLWSTRRRRQHIAARASPPMDWPASPTGAGSGAEPPYRERQARYMATLRCPRRHAQIVAKSPAFAAKRGDPCVDPRSSEAWTMLDDGRFLRTDPRTLAGVVEEHELDPASCPAMIALSSHRNHQRHPGPGGVGATQGGTARRPPDRRGRSRVAAARARCRLPESKLPSTWRRSPRGQVFLVALGPLGMHRCGRYGDGDGVRR